MDAALRKDILITKISKSGGFETRPYIFLSLLHCYTLRFSLLAQTFQWPVAIQNGDMLAPRRQDRQVRKFNFFAAFARDIPSLVAALPR